MIGHDALPYLCDWNYMSTYSFENFVESMDQRKWFRMLVCFVPGLVLGKLSNYVQDSPEMNIAASVVLVVGGAIFYFWDRIRGIDESETDEVDAEPEHVVLAIPDAADRTSAVDHAVMLEFLSEHCFEPTPKALKLVKTEIEVDPTITYGQAVERAYRRMKISLCK